MSVDFFGLLENFELEVARDVVLYSFIAQKSLMPLDLNASEYTLCRRSIFTEEGCRQTLEPNRRILYTLHLDLPRNRECNIRGILDNENRYEAIMVAKGVYNHDLAIPIINAIRLSENKTEKLRRYLNIMKLLELHQLGRKTIFVFDCIIEILHPNCTDSELIVEFSVTFAFSSWVFYRISPMLVGYVLHHTQILGYNLWQTYGWRTNPINDCIIARTMGNICKFLEYGAVLHTEFQTFENTLSELLNETSRNSMAERGANISDRRFFLLYQYFCFFAREVFSENSWEALRCIWRSISDPYLSNQDFYFAFGRVISSRFLQEMIFYYKDEVVEKYQNAFAAPRSLQHLCRVTVRSTLNRNNHLPHGINQLRIPPSVKAYLNLEC